ncbi:hypothetical protein NQ314_018219 [Rhamnusium bicolor]|uniref:PiggyBac transposable element-derived protein domain-containing protein n=1 Tax=Rhamnusium bicolor TaxID=1586634 RepID=A0AAV8WSU8_9CUCU|nr:hypothetical protein NQ314_018219 [Rhamnusium bicolor]
MTITGTLRMNKREIPQEFLVNTKSEEHSSVFGFTNKMTLVSHVPRKNKAFILLSTQFNDAETANERKKKKPIINLHYNANKGAVDTADKMMREYFCVRATRRWPLIFFLNHRHGNTKRLYNIFPKISWCRNNGKRRKFLQILC